MYFYMRDEKTSRVVTVYYEKSNDNKVKFAYAVNNPKFDQFTKKRGRDISSARFHKGNNYLTTPQYSRTPMQTILSFVMSGAEPFPKFMQKMAEETFVAIS